MAFWVLIAVLVASFYISPLLAPKPKGFESRLGDFRPPTAEKGSPIAVVFGTQKVGPNVTWWGNVTAKAIKTITGNRTLLNPFAVNHSTTTGYSYGADIAGVFCWGPIDELIDVQFDEYSARKYATGISPAFPQNMPGTNNPLTITFNSPDLFGGDDHDGGVTGKLEIFFGKLTQVASTILAAKLGTAVSQYKGLVHFIWYNATFGTSPYIKPFFAVVRRCPVIVSPDAATANINGSANAADAIFEIMTNIRWGLGQGVGDFDMASFTQAAITLKAEGMGVDFTLHEQSQAQAIVGEILRHVDAVVFTHPLTGLLTMRLVRADYVVADLPVADKSNIVKFNSYGRNSFPETFNEIKVNYINRGSLPAYMFREDTQQAQNLASMQATGRISSTSIDFRMFSSADIALKTAFREMRTASVPLARGALTVNRKFHAMTVGSCFRCNWEPLGIQDLVFRVASIKAGTLDANDIELTVIEDVFSTSPAVFTPPPPTQWVTPTLAPVAPLHASARPAPYWLTRADAFVGINTVVRGNKAATAWDGYFDTPTTPDGTPGLNKTADEYFTAAGSLVSALRWTAPYQIEAADLGGNGLVLNDYQDMDSVTGTTASGLTSGERLAIIYGTPNDSPEIIAFRDVVANTDGTYSLYGVIRGQFDTLPVDHPAGALVLFISPDQFGRYWDGFPGAPAPTASGQTASTSGYKGWAASKGIAGRRSPEPPTFVISQTNAPLTDPRRAAMPYPPGQTKLNTVANNVIDTTTPMVPVIATVTWVGRNRLTEATTRLHSAAHVAEEAGVIYEVTVLWVNRATGATIWTLRVDTPVVSPYQYTNDALEEDFIVQNGGVVLGNLDPNRTSGGLRFLVRAKSAVPALVSEKTAVPGFKGTQSVGYPVVPSVVFATQGVPGKYYRTLTIDHTKIGATDLVNYPMLFMGTFAYLKTRANGGLVRRNDGFDITFTTDAAGAAFLNWQVESYDPVTGTIVAWVKVPVVSHTVDTVIYLHYGSAVITTFQGGLAANVWDADYEGVWHLPNGVALSGLDSTGHANNLGGTGSSTPTAGLFVGGARYQAGSPGLSASLGGVPAAAKYSIEMWWRADGAVGGSPANIYRMGSVSDSAGMAWSHNNATFQRAAYQQQATSVYVAAKLVTAVVGGVWYHIVVTWDGANLRIYLNGLLETTIACVSLKATVGTALVLGGGEIGNMDEFRLSRIDRSASHILASFNNQNVPATFYALGAEVLG